MDGGPVEGKYCGDDAVGFVRDACFNRALVEYFAVDVVGDAGVVVKTRMAREDVDTKGVSFGFTDLSCAQFGQFVGVLTYAHRHLTHQCAALVRREVTPDVLVGPSG